jgi:hypothetical protein
MTQSRSHACVRGRTVGSLEAQVKAGGSSDNDLPAYCLNGRSVDPKPLGYLPHPLGAPRSLESGHNALLEEILDRGPPEAFERCS